MIENAANVAVTLPSISSSDIGYWIRIYKMGAGNLTINRADSDTIESDVSVANTTASETWANIELFVAKDTMWKIGYMLGSWVTS